MKWSSNVKVFSIYVIHNGNQTALKDVNRNERQSNQKKKNLCIIVYTLFDAITSVNGIYRYWWMFLLLLKFVRFFNFFPSSSAMLTFLCLFYFLKEINRRGDISFQLPIYFSGTSITYPRLWCLFMSPNFICPLLLHFV